MPKANPFQSYGSGASRCFVFVLLLVFLLNGGAKSITAPSFFIGMNREQERCCLGDYFNHQRSQMDIEVV